jgi:ATP-binding cassette subfamily B protein
MAQIKKLSTKEYISAIAGVAKLSFKTAPAAVMFKLLGTFVTALLPIAIAFFAARTINQLTLAYAGDKAAGHTALIYVGITALLGLFTTVWSSVDQYIQQLMRFRVESKVSDMMYEHFLSLDFWQYDDKNTADLYDRAQKFSQFYAYIFDRISSVVSQLITLIFSLIALVLFLPWIALFVLLAVMPGVYIQFKLSRAQIAHWNKNVDVRRAKSQIEWNMLQPNAIAELRLNGLVRFLMNLRQSLRDKDEKARLQYERSYIGKRLLADSLEAAAELISLIWVVLQIIARQQPLGQFVYVQQLVSRAIGGANGFVRELSTIDEDLANLFDYQTFMDLPSRQGGDTILDNPPETIEFTDVSFHYPQIKSKVLKDINLKIVKGQHVAIVGENGAGKSTLIKLLTGLYQPTFGTITLDGVQLKDVDIISWHKKLSVLQQDFQHYIFADIKDNVYYGNVEKPVKDELIDLSLRAAEAYDFVEKLPKKHHTYPHTWMEDSEGNKGTSLSGGQWQRIALARNFYRAAPIIILDEPTSAIDALAEARIFDKLFSKSNSKTVITISHRISTVEKADMIIVLEEGRVVETGSHKELAARKGTYYKLFEKQLKRD